MPHTIRPYPLAPLVALAESMVNVWENDPSGQRRAFYVNGILGTDRGQMKRWRRTGLTEAQADCLAVHIGRHPSEIWPEWFAMAMAS